MLQQIIFSITKSSKESLYPTNFTYTFILLFPPSLFQMHAVGDDTAKNVSSNVS